MMKEEAFSTEFWEHYNRLLQGRVPIIPKKNFESLVLSYYESNAFTKLGSRTQSDYRRHISHIRKIWAKETLKK